MIKSKKIKAKPGRPTKKLVKNALSIEDRLKDAISKSENEQIKKVLDKPIAQMTKEELIFMDKDQQKKLSPDERCYIGNIRREMIMDYLIKVEMNEISMKKGDIARAVNITSQAMSNYIHEPNFQEEYRRRCKEIISVMQSERISCCRKIATNGLNELVNRTSEGNIKKLGVKVLMDLVGFATDVMKLELGEPTTVSKTVIEGNITNDVNVKEQFANDEFRKGFKDLIKKTDSNLKLLKKAD